DNFIHETMTTSVWTYGVEPQDKMIRNEHCRNLHGCVRSPLTLLRIGELSLLTAPGEIDPVYFFGRAASTVDYGAKWGQWYFPAIEGLEQFMPGKHKAMVGQANNYLSYLVPVSDNVGWSNDKHPNHYEELVTIGKNFGDDTYAALLDLLSEEFRGSCQPSSLARSASPLMTE
ncbi:MAG TPA: hypothetical protein VFV50_13015, partial [Bdellovibrionales bacterium]|nr:hypothetical protein [Bdellovibrionales bacterium]